MTLLLVINRAPYDGTDVVWNALRLAKAALEDGMEVRLFLMNEGVDLARSGLLSERADFDLQMMLKDLMAKGAAVKLCQTCLNRCGIGGEEVISGPEVAAMENLVTWVRESEKVLTF